MIQTTLLNYFKCNGPIQQTVNKVQSLKQTNLTDYFNITPKKKNLILDYFKPKVKQERRKKKINKKMFDLVLVDIKNTTNKIICVKRNMYDKDLKYIAISYRWGELKEQLVLTPDYTAHITSFDLEDLKRLCECIKDERDLKEIRYIWIDAISVDQHDHSRKKDTILKMNQVYKRATYILAVPDLHLSYLLKNTANQEVIYLIYKYTGIIYEGIYYSNHSSTNPTNNDIKILITNFTQQHTNNDNHSVIQKLISKKLIKENEELKIENKELKREVKENENIKRKEEIKKAYSFLAYLIDDWSNRAWVISEYQAAKEKYKQYGTPLKYIFMTLLETHVWHFIRKDLLHYFFSYHFDDDEQQQQRYTINSKNIIYTNVDDILIFNQFVKEIFKRRSHLDMILNSNTTRNEDRLNAILPLWDKYKHKIKNKNTVSEWDITDITSVRLKLFEIMDDLWDKAILLTSYSGYGNRNAIFPTFASGYGKGNLYLIEYDDTDRAYERYKSILLMAIKDKEEKERIEQLIKECKINSKLIWTENLINIQLDHHHHHHHYLAVKSKAYFIYQIDDEHKKKDYLHYCPSLVEYDDCLYKVYIPFFTYTIPGYTDVHPPYESAICLIGNIDKNEWIRYHGFNIFLFKPEHFCYNDYTFKIY